ncbi:hypothetical protein SS50377_20617 [Spironucleus salmonicida]|uniref:RING-type domain-containing protein n=1 Tax=Spironucleus salmonicida TaxID=348837 RepID=V6LYJ1_9EUKA|nr:hypothetical protein SS50377_20617 [Spironucleus salmonicida]|eukprot:EST45884.1 hypothetical protein SS50377_14175 [Spironucleus salmonicida]
MPLYLTLSPGAQFIPKYLLERLQLVLLEQSTVSDCQNAVVLGASQTEQAARGLNGPILFVKLPKSEALLRLRVQFGADADTKLQAFEAENLEQIADFIAFENQEACLEEILTEYAASLPRDHFVADTTDDLNQIVSGSVGEENTNKADIVTADLKNDTTDQKLTNSDIALSQVSNTSEHQILPTLLAQLEIQNGLLNSRLSDSDVSRENTRLRDLTHSLLAQLSERKSQSRVENSTFNFENETKSSNQLIQQLIQPQNQPNPQLTHHLTRPQLSNFSLLQHSETVQYANIQNPISRQFLCAICLDPLLQPLTLNCGHSFCAKCALLSERFCGKSCPQCTSPYAELPFLDIYLQQNVNSQMNFDFSLHKNDFARQLSGEFCRVLDVQRKPYDVVTRSLSLRATEKTEIARVQCATGEARTELFNLVKFSPIYSRISTRIDVGDYVVKAVKTVKNAYAADAYTPFIDKFQAVPLLAFAQTQAEIFQFLGFSDSVFRLADYRERAFEIDNLDEYFKLGVENQNSTDITHQNCAGCQKPSNLAVTGSCGCTFCYFCAAKLVRNGVPCQFCGVAVRLESQFFTSLKGSFLECDFPVFCDGKMQFLIAKFGEICVLQTASGARALKNLQEITEIDFSQLVPALRPQNGDLAVQIGKTYNSLAICDKNTISGLFRSGILYSKQYIITNIKLTNSTAISANFCVQCRDVAKRAILHACGARLCRTCAIASCAGGFPCFSCGAGVVFRDVQRLEIGGLDCGTVCMKRHSRVASFGSVCGFVRSAQKTTFCVVFACGSQKVAERELAFVAEGNLERGGRAIVGQLCVVASGALEGVYGILLDGAKRDVLLEIGVRLRCEELEGVRVVR